MTIAANPTTAATTAPADQRATPASSGQPGHPLSLDSLVPPHGGRLVNRIVAVGDAPALRERAAALPRLTLDAREIADLELIATGAASPLTGFLGSADYARVLSDLRLVDGTIWPLPFTLAVDPATAATLKDAAALYDEQGRLWGALSITEIFERDPLAEAQAVSRTTDESHPGVAYLLGRPRTLVAGTVQVLPLPADLSFAAHRFTPTSLRAMIAERGWRRVAGFQTRNPIHRAHEHLTKIALEFADGLVIHPLVGETKQDDVPAAVRFEAYETLVDRYYPPARTLLAAFPAAMRYAGPREALFHAIARKNYGITHLIVGRDHAGVGKFYGPYEAQEIFDRFDASELGVTPLKLEPTFYCTVCDSPASTRTCPHDASARLELSGTKVRELLREGQPLPGKFSRPEVAEILRAHYQKADAASGVAAPAAAPAAPARTAPPTTAPAAKAGNGFVLWFTGLSGAGKSTVANALKARISGRAVEILDGDEVRENLSKGLGFSKADRDTNIRRIGFVARLLARHGVVAITAAISPYEETRNEVRKLAQQEGIPFVEVFANAEIEVLADRDVKGLYRKALAGQLANFTGVSDPYEAPTTPDIVVRSDQESVETSVARVLDFLVGRGLIDATQAKAQG
jgi:sulfate adenylyltransferase